mgnify:CR=1 FL=1
MSENKNEHAENFVLFLIVGALVIGGILYVLFALWPYLVFYVLPIVLGSVVFSWIIKAFVGPSEEAFGFYSYKELSVVMPALIFLIYVVFYAGSERYVEVDKAGNKIAVMVDWQPVHEAFNKVRREAYAGSFFKSLQQRGRFDVIYDRQEMGFIAWVSLLFGALLFVRGSKDDQDFNREEFSRKISERTKYEKDNLREKSAQVDQIIKDKTYQLTKEVGELRADLAAVKAENQVLKARLEFSPEVVRSSESVGVSGVLDADIL